MDKPTIFFSHSSQDSASILPIKNRLSAITANVMDIFMSSDGQSIPFGHNWVHKIEEGLNKAQIMFVFVTPNSVDSAWIYFEAGFAYSKGIEVIPVGIGVNIGQLKAPLNLLQGFDITSVDSLNNFVTVINKKFNLTFSEAFIESDYDAVFRSVLGASAPLDISEVFSSAEYELYAEYHKAYCNNMIIQHNLRSYFSKIIDYLNKQNISYSSSSSKLLVAGMKINIVATMSANERLNFSLSLKNFSKSFNLLKLLFIETGIQEEFMLLRFYFNKNYDSLHDETYISSIASDSNGIFTYHRNNINYYGYKEILNFKIMAENLGETNNSPLYVLGITINKLEEVKVDTIIALVNELQHCGLIFKKKPPVDSLT